MRRAVLIAALAIASTALVASLTEANHEPYLMERASFGTGGGNGAFDAIFRGSSEAGDRVFIETQESLVAADTDSQYDLYQRFAGATTLLSTGPGGGNGAFPESFHASSTDGTKVFFDTEESLVAGDTDTAVDIYQRSAGVTTLVSAGQINGNGNFDATFRGASDDGSHVFFETSEQLAGGDGDAVRDVYDRSGGVTALVSTGPSAVCPAPFTTCPASFAGSSSDGSTVWFDTNERLTGDDTDASLDLFQRAGATTTRLSLGQINGNLAHDAFFAGASANGTRVFFHTTEKLRTGDTDSRFDIYERTGTTTTRISGGQINGNGAADTFLQGASEDGTHVFFETTEQLTAGDTDAQPDIYEAFGAVTTLISTGPLSGSGSFFPSFRGASQDGSKAFFETNEALVVSDADAQTDLYMRTGATTAHISIGTGGNGPHPAGFDGVSENGERVFFHTDESLSGQDRDAFSDVYEWTTGNVTLVSLGPAGGNGAEFADYFGSSANGAFVFLHSDEPLVSADTDSSQDVYAAEAPTGFARPKGATPAHFSLVPAFAACTGSGNRTHGAPLSFASCTPPAQASNSLTLGTPDANGAPVNSISSVRYRVLAGVIGPPEDSDVQIAISITDVRCRPGTSASVCTPANAQDGPDYVGELEVTSSFRITDRYNGGALTDAATGQNTSFPVEVTCLPTGSTSIGADCSITTTANAVLPGVPVFHDGQRTNLELGPIQVFDGGSDGAVSTTPNTVFLTQGVFVP